MADTQIEKAFGTLAEAFTSTENQLNSDIGSIQKQIDKLKEQITGLHSKQETLVHDRDAISAMYERYRGDGNVATL